MEIEKVFENKRFHLIAGLLIGVLTLLVYSNTFYASFHFDDTPQIVENYKIRNLGNLPEIIRGNRGISIATFALNYAIGGLNVVGYHIINLTIHVINGILIYFLIFLTLSRIDLGTDFKSVPNKVRDRAKKIAIYTALLFAVHPIQTQAVTYIVQRMEILASMFMLIGILFFIKGAETEKTAKRALFYGVVALSYLLGFYSKEIAITLPALILLYDYCFLASGDIKKIAGRLPLYLVLLAMLAFFATRTLTGLQETPGGSAGFGVQSITAKEYLFTQFNVLAYYITLLLVPINQNLDYDFPISKGLFEIPLVKEGTILNYPIPPAFVSLVILLAIIGFAVYLFTRHAEHITRRSRSIAFFILWFFIILSPTSSFVPIIDVIFEHRLYLASAGFFFLFSLGFDSFFDYLDIRKAKTESEKKS
ncbi:MAG: hypothetical protein A2X87_04770 [Deltaproteobacteria bacterium GWC2_42_51]|nr:MAG: hypothetical protein A2X87_04770 [Deltaproteobacteria bacterium GWC2_42_51]OGP48105.1 MAG: hypothetical protein A2022_02190 [Deltaproteobacteria bacterium GWF2_42_12]OGQ36756.1 MAG: hypothetical protein A3H47_04585 [Deltaproteobacteria bacterium RIFCSPLOWO2_02_FULL_42_39]OGQ66830.1 MAG: hypothetical protein A3F88_05755 [Deltaproteobacteria bacterium RIFCSPLOWO2_12_FULL_42_16]